MAAPIAAMTARDNSRAHHTLYKYRASGAELSCGNTMHASKGRKYYACTEKRSQKRREIMVTITRRDLCRLALLSLMVAFDGRSYRVAASPANNHLRQALTSACQVPPVMLSFPCAPHTLVHYFSGLHLSLPTLSVHLICFLYAIYALPLSSGFCCLSLTATSFLVYACVDMCHERIRTVQNAGITLVGEIAANDGDQGRTCLDYRTPKCTKKSLGATAKCQYSLGTQQSSRRELQGMRGSKMEYEGGRRGWSWRLLTSRGLLPRGCGSGKAKS